MALLVSVLGLPLVPPAYAEDPEAKNMSLYVLSSSASTYFGEKRSPESDSEVHEDWHSVTASPSSGGSLLGYADPEFSISDVTGWLFSEVSGSSQTIDYSSLVPPEGDDSNYSGMLDYAYFGAANADLGLDSMSSGVMGGMSSAITGSIIWVLYGLAVAVSYLFVLVIDVLKFINPFLWFYEGVRAVAGPVFADGMAQGQTTPTALQGLADFASGWYELIGGIAWQAMVPLFVGFLMIGLVLFKKMDRGGAIKKLVVRVLFIGIGLPLIGSMYTQVLDNFDTDAVSTSGPTKVVASTYVDFDAWMMNDRLRVPEGSLIGWNTNAAAPWPAAEVSVRDTALAINKQSYAGTGAYDELQPADATGDAYEAYRANAVLDTSQSESSSILTTFGMLNRYIAGDTVSGSDFESAIKSRISTDEQPSDEDKLDWFLSDSYDADDVTDFGEADGPKPAEHPIIATKSGTGLQTANFLGLRFYKSDGLGATSSHCGDTVQTDGRPAACNLSPLAAYNYLNSGFSSNSMTLFSSNKATSGFTRENHQSVSQVGTGVTGFFYFLNAAVLLGSIVVLGIWYAVGMLMGSIKRTFSVVGAIPFATLGAMAAISKVVIYSTTMILEVIVTLFLYQFVSEFLITLPTILIDPLVTALSGAEDGLLASPMLGPALTVVVTLVSTMMITAVTVTLLRVRKSVLKAMDEAVTKLVDKFLETNTPPALGKGGGGAMPALAAGIGAGAAAGIGAAARRHGSGGDPELGSVPKGAPKGPRGGGTNAGGTNGPKDGTPFTYQDAADLVDSMMGRGRGADGADGQGAGGADGGRADDDAGASDGSVFSTDRDRPSSQSDKTMASKVESQGGLSDLGVNGTGEGSSSQPTPQRTRRAEGSSGVGTAGRDGQQTAGTSSTAASTESTASPSSRSSGAASGAPADVGSLPTRAERVAAAQLRADADPAFASYMGRKAGSAQDYVARFGGPVLDEVNPQAAKAVDAAGGRPDHVAPHAGQASATPRASAVGPDAQAGATSTSSTITPQAAPRPLSQVPVTSKSGYVTRRPGESQQQFLKARASAEGWTQTPQGWVPPAVPSSTPRTGAPSAPIQPTRAGTVASQTAPRQAVAPSTPQAGAPSAAPSAAPVGTPQTAAPTPAPQVAHQAPARVAPAPSAPQAAPRQAVAPSTPQAGAPSAAPSAAPVGTPQTAAPAPAPPVAPSAPRVAPAPSAPQAAPRQGAAPSGATPVAPLGKPQSATPARSGRVASSGPATQGSAPQAPSSTPAPQARRGTPRKDAQVSVEQNKRRPWWARDDKKKGD